MNRVHANNAVATYRRLTFVVTPATLRRWHWRLVTWRRTDCGRKRRPKSPVPIESRFEDKAIHFEIRTPRVSPRCSRDDTQRTADIGSNSDDDTHSAFRLSRFGFVSPVASPFASSRWSAKPSRISRTPRSHRIRPFPGSRSRVCATRSFTTTSASISISFGLSSKRTYQYSEERLTVS